VPEPKQNLYIFDDSKTEQARLILHAELYRTYIAEHAAAFVPTPPHRILDLGCGVGHLAIELHSLYPQAELVGIDRSAEALAAAREIPSLTSPQVTFVLGNVQEALPPGPFDLVYASLILAYLNDLEGTLDRIYTALAPGGTLWVKDIDVRSLETAFHPDYKSLLDLYFTSLRKGGLHPDIATELPEMLPAAGFSDLRIATDEIYPMGGATLEGDSLLASMLGGIHSGHKMLSRITGVPEEEIAQRVNRVVADAQTSTTPLGYLQPINIVARRPQS
jgi:ubiquinone/menaquinone biosynthesis C-methylase UbiE